jgi:hypothetical protein
MTVCLQYTLAIGEFVKIRRQSGKMRIFHSL